MKKNVVLVLAASIALGSLGLSGYLYQQLCTANGELQLAQASISELNSKLEELSSELDKIENTPEIEMDMRLSYSAIADMVIDEVIKYRLGEELLNSAKTEKPEIYREMQDTYMGLNDFKNTYKAVTGEDFDEKAYLSGESAKEYLSAERIAEIQQEVKETYAKLAEEAKAEETKKQAAQNNTGEVKYGSLWTQEELDAMGTARDGVVIDLTGQDHRGGTPIKGFH